MTSPVLLNNTAVRPVPALLNLPERGRADGDQPSVHRESQRRHRDRRRRGGRGPQHRQHRKDLLASVATYARRFQVILHQTGTFILFCKGLLNFIL